MVAMSPCVSPRGMVNGNTSKNCLIQKTGPAPRNLGIKKRGYYRCNTSKGYSVRRQVERSPTDPNMLLITYTSEHNHLWIDQLAGSKRSKLSKNNAQEIDAEHGQWIQGEIDADHKEIKAMVPFCLFDWRGDNTIAGISF
ncbi:hypothetical protein PTKIN_Ptkin18bG0014300 [Pterospermum kingtungense]